MRIRIGVGRFDIGRKQYIEFPGIGDRFEIMREENPPQLFPLITYASVEISLNTSKTLLTTIADMVTRRTAYVE